MKFLSAGFHSTDTELVNLIVEAAVSRGHSVSLINRCDLSGVVIRHRELQVYQPNDRRERQGRPLDLSSYGVELPCDERTFLRTFPQLKCELKNLPNWDKYVSFARNILLDLVPDSVFGPAGGVEAFLIKEICYQSNLRVVTIVTPFYEFKCEEVLCASTRDICIVAGPIGRDRLSKFGVLQSNIHECGSPVLESSIVAHRQLSSRQNREYSILCPLQDMGEYHYLLSVLSSITSSNRYACVVVRPHPSMSAPTVERYKATVKNISSVRFEQGVPLAEHVARSDVVVSISSLVVIHSLLIGTPVVVWQPQLAPAQFEWLCTFGVPIAKNTAELTRYITEILQKNLTVAGFEKRFLNTNILSRSADAIISTFEKVA